MLAKLLVAMVPVALVLFASEILWRKKVVKGERARKFIHILAGIWMAFWPLYLPFEGIFILSSMAFTLLIYSRVTRLFHAIYAVKRKTYGDIFFAVALMGCSYLGREAWVFTLSILLLAVADGGAAVVGRFWGVRNQYFVFGSKNLRKSIAGTGSFILFTYVCIAVAWISGGSGFIGDNLALMLFALPLAVTIAENTLPYGLDNFFVPVATTIIINNLL